MTIAKKVEMVLRNGMAKFRDSGGVHSLEHNILERSKVVHVDHGKYTAQHCHVYIHLISFKVI